MRPLLLRPTALPQGPRRLLTRRSHVWLDISEARQPPGQTRLPAPTSCLGGQAVLDGGRTTAQRGLP